MHLSFFSWKHIFLKNDISNFQPFLTNSWADHAIYEKNINSIIAQY